jgi:hypothetical protein
MKRKRSLGMHRLNRVLISRLVNGKMRMSMKGMRRVGVALRVRKTVFSRVLVLGLTQGVKVRHNICLLLK